MLGWEFPPAFTGGLGVACYNIVKSLSGQTNVYLIVPYAESLNKLEDISIAGLNTVEQQFAGEPIGKEFENLLLSRVNVRLSAYPSFSASTKSGEEIKNELGAAVLTWTDVANYFQTQNLYGDDVLLRTHLFALVAKQLASKKEFDVIHAHDWPTFDAALEIKHASHKPLVVHIHSLETDRAGEKTRNEIYSIEKQAMLEADKIIAVSDYTRQQIISLYGIEGSKIEVAYNGAESTQRSWFKKKAKEKWITFVGRITLQKGPQFIVEAARKLVRVYPNVRFIIAGSGELFPSLVREVARQKLGQHFSFTGFLSRDKVKDLLASSDAYFMPSVSEPFGLSAVEAVSQGIPAVISNRSGVAEVLTNTLHADFWDTDRMANYLYAILNYPKLKKVIEARSRKDIEQLTWGKTVDKIMNVYKTLTVA